MKPNPGQSSRFQSALESIDLPATWRLVPNRALFDERNTRGYPEEELLSVSIAHGVRRQQDSEERKDTSSEDKTNYKLVRTNDLVYNKMRMWQGAVGVSQYQGIVSPAYVVLKPKSNVYPYYYFYLFRTQVYISECNRYSYGLCNDMNSLRFFDFRQINSILPPMESQKLIVDFLRKNLPVFDVALASLDLIRPWTNPSEAKAVNASIAGLMSKVQEAAFQISLRERAGDRTEETSTGTENTEQMTVQELAARASGMIGEFRSALIIAAVTGKIDIREYPKRERKYD